MFLLLRPLYERWLLRAAQGPLPAWQRQLLLHALQRDEALRCLALELADFGHGAGDGAEAPDLRPALLAEARAELRAEEEQPFFNAAWMPAAALAVMFLVALVVLWQPEEAPNASAASAGYNALLAPEATATPTVVPTVSTEAPNNVP